MSTSLHQTRVVNESETSFELKQGNGGHYTWLTTLEIGKSYTIRCDPNATYCEYWVGSVAGKPETIISSDDCAEYKEIKIPKTPEDGTKRKLVKILRNEVVETQLEPIAEGNGKRSGLQSFAASVKQFASKLTR
jgi:hypothetical protein